MFRTKAGFFETNRSRSALGGSAFVLALALLGACKPPTAEARLRLGTGELDFQPLQGGEELPLVGGPQGGHHIWISFQVEGVSSARMLMDLDIVPLDATEPPERRAPVRVTPPEIEIESASGEITTAYEFVGWPAQLYPAGCYVGVPMLVHMSLTDSEGTVVEAEAQVTPVDPLGDVPECPRDE